MRGREGKRPSASRNERPSEILIPRRLLSLPGVWRYVFAIAIAGAAVVLRSALVPSMGTTTPYNIALVANVLTAFLFGLGPGLLSVVMGDLAVEIVVLRSLPILFQGTTLLRLGTSVFIGALIVGLIHSFRSALLRARRSEELKRAAAEELRGSESRFRTLLNSVPVGIYEIDFVNMKLLSVNDFMCAESGYSREELLAISPLDLLAPEHKELFLDRLRKMMAGLDVPESVEYKIVTKSGRIIRALLSVNFAFENGIPVRARVTATDVTSRKLAEEELARSNQKVNEILTSIQDDFYVLDRGWNFVFANRQFTSKIGMEPRDFIGNNIWRMFPKHLGTALEENFRAAMEKREIRRFEIGGRYTDAWYRMTAYPSADGITVLGTDITEQKRAEAALHESEARFRLALRNAPVSVSAQDRSLRFIWAFNQRSATPDQIIGHTDEEIFTPEEAAHFTAVKRRVLDEGVELHEQTWLDRPSGRMFLDISWEPIRDEAGAVTGVASATVDLTPIKLAEEALRTAMLRLRTLLAGMRSSVLLVGDDSRVAYANEAICRYFGLPDSPDDLVGLASDEMIARIKDAYLHPEEQAVRIREIVRLRQPVTGEEIAMRDGRTCLRDFIPVTSGGISCGRLWQHADITERKKAEEAIRESEERLVRAQEVGQIGWWRLDTRRNVLTWSDENHRIFGVAKGTPLTYETFLEIVHPDDRPAVNARWDAGLRGEPYDIEHRILVRDEVKWVREKAYLEFDATGNLEGGFGITQDITERKRAEEALREGEERLHFALETSRTGAWDLDLDDHSAFRSLEHDRIFGYERLLPQWTYEMFLEHVLPEDREQVDAKFREASATGGTWNFECRIRRADGEVRWIWAAGRHRTDGGGGSRRMAGIVQDITERKQAEVLRQALAEQETLRLGAAVEQASEAVIMVDLDGTIRYVNAAFESINRLERGKAVGRSYFDLVEGDPASSVIRAVVAEGRFWHGPLVRPIPDGRPVELEATISPAREPSGAVVGGLVTEKDVTQENALQRQVRQSQKMEALGTLAGGITHDFNNILGTIIINTELALLDLDPANPARRPLPNVLLAANRGKELVKQIITFSRQREWERNPIEIVPIVKEGLKFLRSTLPKDITIDEAVDPGSGVVMADPSHIHQIMINLCQNAVLAMRDCGGRLEVRLGPLEADEALVVRHPDLKLGPHVRLTVSDTGCGMTSEVMERIFEPFFTTRGPGGGSGLGLAVVHGIVKTYGGTITVYSELGKGSVFHVYLPRYEGAASTAKPDKADEPARGGERILLVEDEETQRASLALGLGRLGYRVTACADGRSALDEFQKDPGAYDLVITDQTMPRMTGIELAEALAKARPVLPVVLCTGFSEKVNSGAVGTAGIRELIMKPFTLLEITRLIRKVAQ